MAYHVYISNAANNWFSHFLMDESSGALTPQPDIELESTSGAVATNGDGTLMFVALRAAKKLASYAVNRSSGQLKKIGTVELEEGPPYVKADNTCSFLLSCYYGSGHVGVHRINADGTLSPRPLQWLPTAEHAHSIQTDRSNCFAFVPHTNPSNAIFQFRFDGKTGTLTPNDPPKVQPTTPEGPRHFAFHPTKDLLYSINENGSTISAHHLDPETGTLSSFQVVSTLPRGADASKNTTSEIKITPDGRFVYGSNRGHDSLALFAVGDDGALERRGHFPTEATPRFFELDPGGRFVYALGQASGYLQSYGIDAASGALQPLERHKVGQSPLWITFVEQA
jgi:6-phosphogluconolactonase